MFFLNWGHQNSAKMNSTMVINSLFPLAKPVVAGPFPLSLDGWPLPFLWSALLSQVLVLCWSCPSRCELQGLRWSAMGWSLPCFSGAMVGALWWEARVEAMSAMSIPRGTWHLYPRTSIYFLANVIGKNKKKGAYYCMLHKWKNLGHQWDNWSSKVRRSYPYCLFW